MQTDRQTNRLPLLNRTVKKKKKKKKRRDSNFYIIRLPSPFFIFCFYLWSLFFLLKFAHFESGNYKINNTKKRMTDNFKRHYGKVKSLWWLMFQVHIYVI